MLTAFADLEGKIKGLQCGADDYLTKPFFMRELLVRIRALTKRTPSTKRSLNLSVLTVDYIQLNALTKKVFRQDVEVILTREYQILYKLMECPGEIVSKGDLIKEIWGGSFDANTNTIEVYINFLRKKLDEALNKKNIKTKIEFGYYFAVS